MSALLPPLPVTAMLLTLGAVLVLFERRCSAWQRKESPGWWLRALFVNALQAVVTVIGVVSWDVWLAGEGVLNPLGGWAGVLAGTALVSFVDYWWHRARHSVPLLWRVLHRFHHSPQRLEVLTAFYRHPLEMFCNGLVHSSLLYFVLGLSPLASSLVLVLLGAAELFAHSNLRSPRLLGVLLPRPEMHRLHHARGLHHYNFSQLPLWDLLFGTFRNPQHDVPLCGFPEEERVGALLLGRRVEEVRLARRYTQDS